MNYLSEAFLENIRKEFIDVSFDYKEVNMKGVIPAFFVQFPNEEMLKNQWESISKFIAGHFQSGLINEFSVWNIYLFFLAPTEITDELKYTIENNTFSSRKIVIAPQQEIDTIIKEHILNCDLNIHQAIVEQEVQFNPNPIIWETLNGIPSKKKVTEDIIAGLTQIITKIKRQEL